MVVGHRIIFIITIITIPVFAIQDGISLHYEIGMEAYKKGQYDLAIQEFESILSNNWDSPEMYYNLGNAFYRVGNTAGAVWAYESCLKLSPTHEDAKYNLKLANLKVIDRMDLPEPPLFLKWYLNIKEQFNSSKWINLSFYIYDILNYDCSIPDDILINIAKTQRINNRYIFNCPLFNNTFHLDR